MPPAVSVLLPVRDAADTVEAAVASIAAQSFDDVELVLVDDGSQDESAARARRAWPRGRPWQLVETGGAGLIEALNRGLAACQGPLVARMDADDVADPRRLALQARAFEADGELAVLGTRVEMSGEVAEGFRVYEAWINALVDDAAMRREIFIESPLVHPSVMYRRDVVAGLGGYRERDWPEDYDLWLRVARAGFRLGKLEEVLLAWRDAPGRHSRTHPRYSPDAFWRCKAHHLARWPWPGRERLVLWGAGKQGRRFARYLRAQGVVVAAFVDIDPRKVGRTLAGTPVIAPDDLPAWRHEALVAAVGTRGARELIRAKARDVGYREGIDFLCAA